MALKDLFKPGAILGKGGIAGKALVGLANIAVSKVTGGVITNLFTPSKLPDAAKEANTTANAQALIQSVGAGVGTMQALYQPSTAQLQAQAIAQTAPLGGIQGEKMMYGAGQKSFLAQYWGYLAGGFALLVLGIFALVPRRRR